MGKIIPYRTRYDRLDNKIYAFRFKASKNSLKAADDYATEIKIDEETNKIVETYCECADTLFNKNKLCKHKKKAMEVLKKHGIQFRYKEGEVSWLWENSDKVRR